MSYQNPLIIQNNPGGNIGEAANKAATSIQDAILFNMAKQEKKQEEIAKKQAIDDANAIAAAKESSTEEADARKALAANEYSAGGMGAFSQSSALKFDANQIVSNVNATREDRLAAQEKINAENTFQQNQVGALAYFSEDKTELATLRTKGNVYSMEGVGGAYVRFLDGDPNVKLSGKRVGNDWVNTLTYDGKSYELPTDKIKDGSFEAFALTPDLYDGIDAQAKEINAARNKREKGMQEFTPNDLSGITEAVNVNIQKATANFDSYLKMDPMKAKAILANTVYPEKKPEDIEIIFNGLTAGGKAGVEAFKVVEEELKKDIEYKWGMNTGVFRNDKDEFEVMKPEEPGDTKSSVKKENKYETADRKITTQIVNNIINDPDVDDKNSFAGAFFEQFPQPTKIDGSNIISLDQNDTGFVVKFAKLIPNPNVSESSGDIDMSNFRQDSSAKVNATKQYDFSNSTEMGEWIELTGGGDMSKAARKAAAEKIVAHYKKFN